MVFLISLGIAGDASRAFQIFSLDALTGTSECMV
jgi:hypothetical protein